MRRCLKRRARMRCMFRSVCRCRKAIFPAPMDVPDGFIVESAAKMRACVSIPVIAVDRINTPELAEQTIAQGKADFIAVGRGMLADPQFVNKIGTENPIRLCLGCNQGCRKSVTKKRFIVCRIRLRGVSGNGRSRRCLKDCAYWSSARAFPDWRRRWISRCAARRSRFGGADACGRFD